MIPSSQLPEILARLERNSGRVPPPSDAVECESDLHQEISDYCKSKGWLCFHGSMAHRSMRTIGEPDFIVAADEGRVFFIEAKAKRGKVTTEQLATIAHLRKLGHHAGIVYSMADVLELISQSLAVSPDHIQCE